MSLEPESSSTRVEELEARLRRMQGRLDATSAELTAASKKLASVTTERDNLRRAYRQLMEQFELLRRRIFIAKAERVDATQLEFEKTKKELDELAQKLAEEDPAAAAAESSDTGSGREGGSGSVGGEVGSRPSGKPASNPKVAPKGRRNLGAADHLAQRRIEIRDAELEKSGAVMIGWEESYKLGYQRPEPVCVTIARAKYKVPTEDETSNRLPADATVLEQSGEHFTIITAPLPPLLIRRGSPPFTHARDYRLRSRAYQERGLRSGYASSCCDCLEGELDGRARCNSSLQRGRH